MTVLHKLRPLSQRDKRSALAIREQPPRTRITEIDGPRSAENRCGFVNFGNQPRDMRG
jgi:hypothetical protein